MLIGQGGQGSIYRNGNKVLKVANKFNQEYNIAKVAGNIGVGPKVHGKTNRGYIMNFIDGKPLSKVRNVGQYRNAVKAAVNALHKHGIGHMNLHEDNIIIGSDGKVYIIDYGSAKKANNPVTNNMINQWLKNASGGKKWHRFYEVGNQKLLSNREEMNRIFGPNVNKFKEFLENVSNKQERGIPINSLRNKYTANFNLFNRARRAQYHLLLNNKNALKNFSNREIQLAKSTNL